MELYNKRWYVASIAGELGERLRTPPEWVREDMWIEFYPREHGTGAVHDARGVRGGEKVMPVPPVGPDRHEDLPRAELARVRREARQRRGRNRGPASAGPLGERIWGEDGHVRRGGWQRSIRASAP